MEAKETYSTEEGVQDQSCEWKEADAGAGNRRTMPNSRPSPRAERKCTSCLECRSCWKRACFTALACCAAVA